MRKKVGIVKRMLCLLLIFLLSINSFAAIVSDNDGSAFITKAEFDALKSDFQAQIDTYNQSIDSKIDGAIANYLSGIKIATDENIKTVLKKGQKIRMLKIGNELIYKKGLMKDAGIRLVTIRGYSTSTDLYRKYMWVPELTFKLKTSTNPDDYNFNKIYISDIDDSERIGAFYGYYLDEQEQIKMFQYSRSPYGVQSMTRAGIGEYGRFYSANMLYKSTNATWDGSTGWCNALNVAASSTALDSTNTIGNIEYGVAFFQRITGTCACNHVLIPKAIPYNRFTDYSRQLYNFSNDAAINSTYNTIDKIYDKIELKTMQLRAYDDATEETIDLKVHTTSSTDFWPPYEGFTTTITNWNQVYDSAFDDVANTYTTGVIIDSKGNRHLMSYAGLPIVKVEKDQTCEYILEFEDTSKEYDVWVKFSPFGDMEQDSEPNLIQKISARRGSTIISRGVYKYLTVKSGDTLIVENIDKNGYVFIKWREKNDMTYGGGVLVSTGEAKIIKN